MIDNMDNETMVEAFKYLNYCQLAKNSLVSMRFRNVIQTHRHKLALLYVSSIRMEYFRLPHVIEVFGQELSSQTYNDWVICNQYSKQVPLEDQVVCTEGTQSRPNGCCVTACYKDLNHHELNDSTTIYFAQAELNHENWPLFQHFVRLVTDPFIFVDYMRLTYENNVLNLLSGTVNPNRRLQCKNLDFNHRGNTQKSLTWIKNHVQCNQLYLHNSCKDDLNHEAALFDFFMTGGHCTSAIEVGSYTCIHNAVNIFVQKFMDLKDSNESRFVDVIEGYFDDKRVESLKRDYAKFVVKEERDEDSFELIVEFANNDIGNKLQLTIKYNEQNSLKDAHLFYNPFKLVGSPLPIILYSPNNKSLHAFLFITFLYQTITHILETGLGCERACSIEEEKTCSIENEKRENKKKLC